MAFMVSCHDAPTTIRTFMEAFILEIGPSEWMCTHYGAREAWLTTCRDEASTRARAFPALTHNSRTLCRWYVTCICRT